MQPSRKRRKLDPMTPPPPASEFPAYAPRDYFRFEIVHRWEHNTDCGPPLAEATGRQCPCGLLTGASTAAQQLNAAPSRFRIRSPAARQLELPPLSELHLAPALAMYFSTSQLHKISINLSLSCPLALACITQVQEVGCQGGEDPHASWRHRHPWLCGCGHQCGTQGCGCPLGRCRPVSPLFVWPACVAGG